MRSSELVHGGHHVHEQRSGHKHWRRKHWRWQRLVMQSWLAIISTSSTPPTSPTTATTTASITSIVSFVIFSPSSASATPTSSTTFITIISKASLEHGLRRLLNVLLRQELSVIKVS